MVLLFKHDSRQSKALTEVGDEVGVDHEAEQAVVDHSVGVSWVVWTGRLGLGDTICWVGLIARGFRRVGVGDGIFGSRLIGEGQLLSDVGVRYGRFRQRSIGSVVVANVGRQGLLQVLEEVR